MRRHAATVPAPALALALGAATALWWILRVAPDSTWLDGPELAAASLQLGVAHPPGHPLPLLLGRAVALLLPLGSAAFRTNLASALAMGLAVAGLARLAAELAERLWSPWANQQSLPVPLALAAGALPALLFAASSLAEAQAVRTEVYALEAATSAWAAWFALHSLDARHQIASRLFSSGLLFGLSLSNHHIQALTVFIPCCLALLAAHRRLRPGAALAAGLLLGLASWLYLPVRAAAEPLVNWGHPDTLAGLWWSLSTHMYRQTPMQASARLGLHLAWACADLARQNILLLPAALLGLYLLLRTPGLRPVASVLGSVVALSLAAAVAAAYRSDNPDSGAYVLPALAALGLGAEAAGLALASLAAKRLPPRRLTALGLVVLTFLWAPSALRAPRAPNVARDWSASETGLALLSDLPPSALFLAGYHETVFVGWYLQTAEGLRPDVCLVHRFGLFLPGRFPQMLRRCPVLARLVRKRRFPAHTLLRSPRPPVLEPSSLPGDPVTPKARRLFVPKGPLAHVGAPDPHRDLAAWRAFLHLLGRHRSSPGVRRFLLWHAYHSALTWAEMGHCRASAPTWGLAHRLAPADPLVSALGRRCNLKPGSHATQLLLGHE